MALVLGRISISTRRKLASILLAVVIFALLAALVSLAHGRPGIYAVVDAVLVGSGVGLFEQFYVQSLRGRWFRNVHPLSSIALYTLVVAILFVIAINLTHWLLHWFYPTPVPWGRLPFILPIVIALSVIGIVVMRAAHFIGIDTVFHLMIGTYHRPVVEQKVLVFVDINNSTGLAERLAPSRSNPWSGNFCSIFRSRSLITAARSTSTRATG